MQHNSTLWCNVGLQCKYDKLFINEVLTMRQIEDELILESINALQMSDNERGRALRALATAEAITGTMLAMTGIFNRTKAEPQGARPNRLVDHRTPAMGRGL
jgi:hypothetical protein